MIAKSALAAAVAWLLLAAPCAAGVYYWIDENGVKHFSTEPPPEGTAVIERSEEIPHDEAEARRYQMEQERTWRELEQKLEERRRQREAEERRRQQEIEAEQERAEAEKRRLEQERQAIREKRYESGTYEQKRRRRERAAEQQGQ